MDSAVLQLLVLAGIAIFLVLRLKSVLGSREGFEKPPLPENRAESAGISHRPEFEVIEGGPDTDITDYVEEGSKQAEALAEMKRVDPDFHVGDFLNGARQAYEMILMAFESGDMDALVPFLSRDVYESFMEVVEIREREGLTVEAAFVGLRDVRILNAYLDPETSEAEITIRFDAELTSVVRNSEGEIVEGDPNEIKRQKDVWTFARDLSRDDPNWQLVATGE
ncbi:Tim44/TimA family putative adaptor protein [Alkalilacustris brevis]|uniref:Tim44/TimA family putative adaptor protein n=1 Tax=Alkalilacustris brevis TaxID=2026338 RepID=UPI000E0DD084|nr:Tim44/TimA family putative adaptor protein [Alkalilacustris brevis]